MTLSSLCAWLVAFCYGFLDRMTCNIIFGFSIIVNMIELRASALVDVKLRKIQKATNFTHFALKIFHISPKIVYVYIFATVTVHIYTVTVAVYYIILLISYFAHFSLSSPFAKPTQTSSLPHHLLPPIHTNTLTQTNQHRDAQKHMDRLMLVDRCCSEDQCLLVAEIR